MHLCNPSEANVVFIALMNSIKDSLNKILIQGDFEQFSEEPRLHCTTRLREMFENYYKDLCKTGSVGGAFLAKESKMLEEAKGTQSYPALQSMTRRAIQALILKKRNECVEYVKEMLEMEVVKKTVAIDEIGELDVSEALEMDSNRVEEVYDMWMSVVAY
eukprot:Gb_01038 [translate_table: standard]